MNKPKKNNIFLISFIPAVAYWYLEANYSIKTAVIGGMILSVLEILFEKIFFKHVHQISKINFFLMFFLGGFSLANENGIWFKLQSFISMWIMSFFMLYKRSKGKGLFVELMQDMNDENVFSEKALNLFERNFIVFFLIYGALMGGLAVFAETNIWAFFKSAGFFICCGIFSIVQGYYLIKGQKNEIK